MDSRDESAFQGLYDRYAADVFDCISRSYSWAEAEPQDVVQELFLRLWEQPHAFLKYSHASVEGPDSLRAALITAGRRKLFDASRSKLFRTSTSLDADEDVCARLPAENQILPSDPGTLETVLAVLEQRDQLLIKDRFLHDRSYSELVELYHEQSVESVRKRIERALEKLRHRFGALGITCSALALEIRILNAPTPVLPRVPRPAVGKWRWIKVLLVVGILSSLLLTQRNPRGNPTTPGQVPTSRLSFTVERSTSTANSAVIPQPARAVASAAVFTTQNPLKRANMVKNTVRTTFKSRVTGGGTTAGHEILDQPGVRSAIAGWNPPSDLMIVEQSDESDRLTLPGVPIKTVHAGEELDGQIIPTGWLNLEEIDSPHTILGSGLNLLGRISWTLQLAKGKPDSFFAMELTSEGELSETKTRELFLNWASVSICRITHVNVGTDWATLHFTAMNINHKRVQDGRVNLRIIISTPKAVIWGAEKVVLLPSQSI